MDRAMDGSWPKVAIIVPTYQDQARLRVCLNCLLKQDYPGECSITVVDNEGAFTLDALQEEYPGVNFLWEPLPGSYNARNKGIAETGEPVLAFTDSDCSPDPLWLQAGVAALYADPAIGLVGGRIVVEAVGKDRISLGEYFEMALGFPQHIYVKTHHFAATANLFTRRSVFDAVGLFNGALKSGGDSEWGKRVCAAGYSAVYEERASLIHPARNTSEVFAKIKRTVGGARDRDPSWSACLRFVLEYAFPPIRRMARVARFRHPGLSWSAKGMLVGYCLLINWRCATERLLIQLFNTASRR